MLNESPGNRWRVEELADARLDCQLSARSTARDILTGFAAPRGGLPPSEAKSKDTVRILLLTDIHANLPALEACLAAAPSFDQVANLGDIVGYGASPNEVTERARSLGGMFVRGNHDKACTGVSSLEYFNPVAGLAAMWTQQNLTPENFQFLHDLPQGPIPLFSGDDPKSAVYLVHGSPLDEDEYLISIRDALDVLQRSSVALTFFGHTHLQGWFSLDTDNGAAAMRPGFTSRDGLQTWEMPLNPKTKYLVNPGSVGQPRDGDWRAAFAVYDSDRHAVTFYRVPYDVKQAQTSILTANLPERLAARLGEGR